MTIGESSNDQVFEMIACCDIAQAQGTNVGVKAALKTRPNRQWWRRYTRKCAGNTLEINTPSERPDRLAK
jgi:hypothetical protein